MIRVLVIEREFGAGGACIAQKAAERLGWRLMDHELTAEIAKLAKVSTETCRESEERVDPWLYRLAKVFWRGSWERSVGLPDADIVDADRLVCLTEKVMREQADVGHCVIVGRGAPYFLRDRADTVRVFVYAPRDYKYRRVLDEVKNEAEAKHLIDTVDREREEFIRHYYNSEWPARHLYNAMFNTAVGDEETVENILRLIETANKREAASK
jgi:cytidylate kinase